MSTTISHDTSSRVSREEVSAEVALIAERLRAADHLLLPLDQELELLEQLQDFEFGRFLLRNKGLNGYWTSYVFGYADGDAVESSLEKWLLTSSLLPGIRERFGRFKVEVAKYVRDDAVFASVPCGLMGDLLQQDYSGVDGVRLIGVDIDPESVRLAEAEAIRRGLVDRCQFLLRDAWTLGLDGDVDLLVSNGLNMYEPERERLVQLYRGFGRALRPGGRLLISFIPAPPPLPWLDASGAEVWAKFGMGEADLRQDLAIFGDILGGAKYMNFTSEDELRAQLQEAGLRVDEVSYSEAGVLPIATATRA
ncbi:SAM-dependent methyltransferase [Luteipulveratus mongoliensis]|uniref:SAM-dependent methyltransferase n=1 Tax=Luteipulveratus mongoliensis TaxID=571913 RepID=UPI0006962285|nr:class I SAM-dependent methyltransferase [Luteipulveratus mongoliensis]